MAPPVDAKTVQEAISVSAHVARDWGLAVDLPVPLRSTNNAVAWLRPANVVAKVSVGRKSRLHTDLQVARHLCSLDAPVVSPALQLPDIVHCRGELQMTFWRYHAQPATGELPPDRVARRLRQLHAALARLPPVLLGSLPTYMGELSDVLSLLTDHAALPAISAADRGLLVNTFDQLRVRLEALVCADRFVPIHGAPHPHNVLVVDGEPAFIDFETACLGPVEWDLAHLAAEAEPFFCDLIQPKVLWLTRSMASVKTAVLCSADINRGDMREHAEWHLSYVRHHIAPNIR
jgi:hypothetical protein